MALRMTLALLFIVPAAMTYPWQSVHHRWMLGVAIAVLIVLFARWRGAFVTTLIARRWAVWRRNHRKPESRAAGRVSVTLRVEPGVADELPLEQIAGYVDRYGILCESVRVISREAAGGRDTWVSLTLDAAPNLAALQGRSSELRLDDTGQVVARRLAGQLREHGLTVTVDPSPEAPLRAGAREGWRAVRDDDGFLTGYALVADAGLAERLAGVQSESELWTVLEFTGTAAKPAVAAACAVRTSGAPAAAAVPGLLARSGMQRPLLQAMDPSSERGLQIAGTPLPQDLTWSVRADGLTVSRT